GLCQPAAPGPVRKVKERGAIQGYVPRLDPRLLGNDIRAFVRVRIAHPRHHDGFIRKILEIDEVLECHRVAGLDSYLLKVVTRDTRSLDELVCETPRRIPAADLRHAAAHLSTATD